MREANSIMEILAYLHIDIIGGRIESVHKMIRENYRVKKYVVETYQEFVNEISLYYSYHNTTDIGAHEAMPFKLAKDAAERKLNLSPDTRISKVQNIINEGGGGGYLVAAKNSETGRHGGLPAVIDIIAEGMTQDAVKAYVKSVFLSCVNPLDYNKKMAFMAEYLKMFGGVLLPNEDLLSVYELANNVEAVLQNHVRLVNEFRKTLQ